FRPIASPRRGAGQYGSTGSFSVPPPPPAGKLLRTFPGLASYSIATPGRKTAEHFSWGCLFIPPQPPGGKLLRTFPGLASYSIATPGRKTAEHFSWGCLFTPPQPPGGKPLRTFPGVASYSIATPGRKTAAHFSWGCLSRLRLLLAGQMGDHVFNHPHARVMPERHNGFGMKLHCGYWLADMFYPHDYAIVCLSRDTKGLRQVCGISEDRVITANRHLLRQT